jgi:hypothetical protein
MRTAIPLRHNPAPLYFRLRAGLGLLVIAGIALGASTLGIARRSPSRAAVSGAKSTSALVPSHSSIPRAEGSTLENAVCDPNTDPHSFLPYSIEAGRGRATHPWTFGHPSSLARSRLSRPSSLSAYGPDLPLALAIPQDTRLFPYPALRRESRDWSLKASVPEARLRASACLDPSGAPGSLTDPRPAMPASSAVASAAVDGPFSASATIPKLCAYQYIEERAEDLLPRDVLSPLLGFRHPTASRNS